MAFTGRKAAMAMMFEAEWKDDSKRDRCVEWVRRVWRATERFAEGTYNNFDEHDGEQRLESIYGAEKYRKLQRLKAKYDPHNLFHRNHNITPASDRVAPEPVDTAPRAKTIMRVARVAIHAYDMEESTAFYRDVLGFVDAGESTRTSGARVMVSRSPAVQGHLEFDLVPNTASWTLPSPFHFALESDPTTFENVFGILRRRGAKMLSAPPPAPNTGGYGTWSARGAEYRRFFFLDPTLIFHELLVRVGSQPDAASPSLRVNHLIVCTPDVPTSVAFYVKLFGFKDLGKNEHNQGARTLVHYSPDNDETFEIVVHPYHEWLTPNPSQFSLEVDRDTFARVLLAADEHQIAIASAPDPTLQTAHHRRLFVVDPSGTRIEVLANLDSASSPKSATAR
jgi:catechol 2,3-dioxygenase-like lactoylglutathione lyase family enzyme